MTSGMFNLRMFKLGFGKKGAEEYGGHHQVLVELMPVALGVIIVLILGLLVFLLLKGKLL